MHLNLSADQVLTTTRSVRKRLDYERPVEREVLMECLDIALQAPTGSNLQGWQWIFVTDPAPRQALADIYAENFAQYSQLPGPDYDPSDPRAAAAPAVSASAQYLADTMHLAPVILVPCLRGNPAKMPGSGASFWGSLLPAVWSFMLALRERGLGSSWTTIHLMNDGEARAAQILGIPEGKYAQAGLFPIAYTKGTDFKPARRLPAAEVTHWNTW